MKPNPVIDCHTHTRFSDGTATFDEVLDAAIVSGCRTLAFTDHLTLPASMDPSGAFMVKESRLAERRAAFERARTAAARRVPDMELVYGFECDWYEGCEENIARWSAGAAILLGGVHWIGSPGEITAGSLESAAGARVAYAGGPASRAGWIDDPGDLHLWRELGPDEVWRRYATTWCRACESPLAFDVMAHPDLAVRFANEGFSPTRGLKPLWNEMVACARDTGRRIEVSTAGMRKSVRDYYPTRDLLEMFTRAGVPITFGSDAHRASDVCSGISDAQAYAYECGYRSFDAPHADGSWERLPLR